MNHELDTETAQELMDAFEDLYEESEGCLTKILSGGSAEDLNGLFRAVHSIKGNAAILHVLPIVDYTHTLENIVDGIRGGQLPATPSLCEVIQLGMDRLRDLHQRELLGVEFASLDEKSLEDSFVDIEKAGASGADAAAKAFLAKTAGVDGSESELQPENIESNQAADLGTQLDGDLAFFKGLALQVDNQSRYWKGRTEQIQIWAEKVNQISGSLIDSKQLAAACYVHDLGMTFIRNEVLDKKSKLSDEELAEIREHPKWGAGLLSRMQGWEEAATIVLDHHEHENGKGYPNQRSGQAIHPGAKVLAIIDTFFSITAGRADRESRRTAVRAISEINARKGTQFDGDWVDHFNEMVRLEVKNGQL